MKILLLLSVSFTLNAFFLTGQIVSGPMVGYTEMRQAAIWLQTDKPVDLQISWWDSTVPGQKFITDTYRTKTEEVFTARFELTGLIPGRTYVYQVISDGLIQTFNRPLRFKTQMLWQHRSDPPDLRIAFGSCLYINETDFDRPGKPYGGDYQILEAMGQSRPDIMVWLGDNTYFREPDFGGFASMAHRYSHTRALPELQSFLSLGSHIAIWDDHDFGPNDANGTFAGKSEALHLFQLFWANPPSKIPELESNTGFHRFGDVEFYLLDNRWYRTPCTSQGDGTILGEKQLQWLINALTASKAQFKFVVMGGQLLNDARAYENYANCGKERQRLLVAIDTLQISNVVFLSGDRHHSEVSRFKTSSGKFVHDFTCSPLTSRPHENLKETNQLRIPGSLIKQRNYGLIEITGPQKERKLKVIYYDSSGKEIYRYEM